MLAVVYQFLRRLQFKTYRVLIRFEHVYSVCIQSMCQLRCMFYCTLYVFYGKQGTHLSMYKMATVINDGHTLFELLSKCTSVKNLRLDGAVRIIRRKGLPLTGTC